MKCPRDHCGGDLSFDREDEKWKCSLCERSWTPEELKELTKDKQSKTPRRKKAQREPVGFYYFTDVDLDILNDEEFWPFWTALGRVLRARIKRERKAE